MTSRGTRIVALMALLTVGAFAQTAPADQFGQPIPGPACSPSSAPAAANKKDKAIQAMKGGAEFGAVLGTMTGARKGVMIGTVAGGVAGLIWELTSAKHADEVLIVTTPK